MNKHVLPFAGYPIYIIKSEFNLNDEELNFLKSLEYKEHPTKFLKISSNADILKLEHLKRLKEFIKESLNDYVSNVLEINNKISFCQSWSTIQNEGSHHPYHVHENHLFSCVYYAKAEKTELTFSISKSKIQDSFFFDYDIKNNNIFNSRAYTIPLKTGDIIFFPGHLGHETSLNKEKERIAVGASFFIEGKLGSHTTGIDITNNKNIKY